GPNGRTSSSISARRSSRSSRISKVFRCGSEIPRCNRDIEHPFDNGTVRTCRFSRIRAWSAKRTEPQRGGRVWGRLRLWPSNPRKSPWFASTVGSHPLLFLAASSMEVWAARVPLKARPHRQRLLSQKNSLQTALRFSARSQLERLVAALAAQLAKAAAQLVAPAPPPPPPFPHAPASAFLRAAGVAQPFVRGFAAYPPFHHEVAPRFLLCRWTSLCSARNHNSTHKPSPATRASRAPRDRRGDQSGSSSRR